MTTFRGRLERAARAAGKRALGELVRHASPTRAELPLSTFGLERDDDGALAMAGVQLESLLARFGSPLFVVDVERLDSNARRFVSRRAEPFVSYKTNPVPGVLRMLHAQGLGAEAASPYELWLALQHVAPRSILFDGPAKTRDSIALAVGRGVLLNLDDHTEIDKVADVAKSVGVRARVGLRVVPPGSFGGQFGEAIEGGRALAAFRAARARPELEVVGLHAHANGEIACAGDVERFVAPLLSFASVLRRELGLALEVLDFGGNLASPTVSHLSSRALRLATTFGVQPVARAPSSVLSIEGYLDAILARVDAHYAGERAPRVFLEPGRALMSDAQMLLCRVISAREVDGVRVAVLDGGINVADAVRNELHQLYACRDDGRARVRHRIVGPSCTLGDLLYPAWSLPELRADDAVAIMDAGAYLVPYSTTFSFPRPAIVAVARGRVEMLRRAERFDDLIARDVQAAGGTSNTNVSGTGESTPYSKEPPGRSQTA